MASTDIIYGITMIEAGVSRVVPVDLRELDWSQSNFSIWLLSKR
jgi:hypothetical protein